MENWRRYTNEQMAAGQEDQMVQMMKNLRELPDKVPRLTATDIRHLISLVDPTQISAYPDIPPAIKRWKKSPSWFNSAMLVLALLAVIPIFGKGAKLVSRFSRSLKTVKGASKYSAKINKVVKTKQAKQMKSGTTKFDDSERLFSQVRNTDLKGMKPKLNILDAHLAKVDRVTDNLERELLRLGDDLEKWLSTPRATRKGPRPSMRNDKRVIKARQEFRDTMKKTSQVIANHYGPLAKQGRLTGDKLKLYNKAVENLKVKAAHVKKMEQKAAAHAQAISREGAKTKKALAALDGGRGGVMHKDGIVYPKQFWDEMVAKGTNPYYSNSNLKYRPD